MSSRLRRTILIIIVYIYRAWWNRGKRPCGTKTCERTNERGLLSFHVTAYGLIVATSLRSTPVRLRICIGALVLRVNYRTRTMPCLFLTATARDSMVKNSCRRANDVLVVPSWRGHINRVARTRYVDRHAYVRDFCLSSTVVTKSTAVDGLRQIGEPVASPCSVTTRIDRLDIVANDF